ncbi:MAG: hypothetical protein ABIM49_04005 [candidate division WOR-3 bacterium]|uniref:Uncharacterized protein n=1 Tax=candidate division WOR-3 bacterium TaxID=2052148 RepID=A0A7V3ZS85_UNCW3
MKFLEYLAKIDRRIIYLILAIFIIIPLIKPLNLPIGSSHPVKSLFDFIEKQPEGAVIVLSMDYDASVYPECHPMSRAIARHAFLKNLRLIGLTLNPAGTGLALEVMTEIPKEYNKKYGKDYVFLGFRPDITATILGFGEDIRKIFPYDYFGNKTDTLPIFKDVKNYDQIALVVSISGSALPVSWIYLARGRYGQDIAAGVTAVMAADYYPYLRTGQFVGLLGGMKGAAEYEKLIERRELATSGIDAVSISHILIILFVIIGNIGYIVLLKRRK